jgi:ketosteroid isomerase-like protein
MRASTIDRPGMHRLRTVVLGASTLAIALVVACGGPRIPPPPRPVAIPDPEQLVGAYYRRVNAEDLEGVLALMVREPVLTEPFSHPPQREAHRGYRGVAEFFANAFRSRDDQIVPEYIRASGNSVEAGWSLQGSDGTGMSGVSHFAVTGGQISSVDIEIRE